MKVIRNWIFQKNKNITSISKYKSNNDPKNLLINRITQEITKLDQKISNESKELLQTQVIGIKAALSMENNWLYKLQKKIYWPKIQNSVKWQRDNILQLYKERRRLQIELDRLTGRFWVKQIRQWITIALLIIICIFAI